MNGQFKVGEIAILQNLVGDTACYNGTECEITEPLQRRTVPFFRIEVDVYTIRNCDGEKVYVLEKFLRKKRPPQEDSDRNTVVEWKECGWQPNKVPA